MSRYRRLDHQGAWDVRYFANGRELRQHAQELVRNSYEEVGETKIPKIKRTKQAIQELGYIEFEIDKVSEEEYQRGEPDWESLDYHY